MEEPKENKIKSYDRYIMQGGDIAAPVCTTKSAAFDSSTDIS